MTSKNCRAPLLFYAVSSFVHHHHFNAIGELKLELRSRKAQFGSKLAMFIHIYVTLTLHGWPWKNNRVSLLWYFKLCASFLSISEFKLKLQSGNVQFGSKSAIFFVPCDLEICQMTFKNNRVPLLCYFKLCASFHNHRCIQTRGTDRKRPIWVKIGIFLPRVTLKFDGWHWKSIGHLLYATSNFVHHFITISEFKL